MPPIDTPSTLINCALDAGAFSAAQLCVVSPRYSHAESFGHHVDEAPITDSSLFDVASLTKLIATTTFAVTAIAEGALTLDTLVMAVIPEFSGHKATTVFDLLAHRSGLPPWRPLFGQSINAHPSLSDFQTSRALTLSAAMQTEPSTPIGQRHYSDVGFIVLGQLLERVMGVSLDQQMQTLATTIGLAHTQYRDLTSGSLTDNNRIVITGTQRPRPVVLATSSQTSPIESAHHVRLGEVDDDNAYALGGIAGHAGLFSTATDVTRFGQWVMANLHDSSRMGDIWRRFATIDNTTTGPARGLGFDVPSAVGSTIGSRLGFSKIKGANGAVGHLGFTGCSLWIDQDREAIVVFLSNRVYRDRHENPLFRALRPKLHDTLAVLIDDSKERGQ